MDRRLVIGLTLAVGVLVAAHAADGYNKQNPKWEAGRPGATVHENNKPYKPLRQPPGSLPTRSGHAHNRRMLDRRIVLGLASFLALGVAAEWLSWRFGVPDGVLLVGFGIVIGPGTGLVHPDALFGNLLLPGVSLVLALALFSSGLAARFDALDEFSGISGLVNFGLALNILIVAGAAHVLLGLHPPLAALLGAILVMTGRRLVTPLRMAARGGLAVIVEREAAALEVIGVTLAVLFFEATVAGNVPRAISLILRTVAVGGLGAVAAAGCLLVVLRSGWVPDALRTAASLVVVLVTFSVSHAVQPDAGFLAVVLTSVFLANQRFVDIQEFVDSQRSVVIALASAVLVVLGARLGVDELNEVGVRSAAFVAAVVLIARPTAVVLSTLRSSLSWRERLFLAGTAPRGAVVAMCASIFGLRLLDAGDAQAGVLVAVAFLTIIGSGVLSGVAWLSVRWIEVTDARPVARGQRPSATEVYVDGKI